MKSSSRKLRIASVAIALLLFVASGFFSFAGAGTWTHGTRVIGYFASWSVYGRDYHVKNVEESGSAARLTAINYAFANIGSNLRCAIGDSYADYDRYYDAGSSVDGVADSWEPGALRGNFNQLRKLKAMHPKLKIFISIGGWTWSSRFSDAALPENREAFVESCIDMFIRGNFAPGLSYPGIFDGIDIDWEYPGTCGESCNWRPEDTENFTALLAEFRRRLNKERPGLILTIAAPADELKIAKIEGSSIHRYLNWMNIMAYDFHGSWDAVTNFQSALYPAAGDPARSLKLSVKEAVLTWRKAGIPPRKLVVGVPFYGRGWTDVPAARNGLWQLSKGPAPGPLEPGIMEYGDLVELDYPAFWSSKQKAGWIYSADEGVFWTVDGPSCMKAKVDFVRAKGLGGIMFWALPGDTADGKLVKSITRWLRIERVGGDEE